MREFEQWWVLQPEGKEDAGEERKAAGGLMTASLAIAHKIERSKSEGSNRNKDDRHI